ncbi:hypothetical protein [Ferrimonas pelagia]|uniref:hypothetical protein n=1 Tax=Ferrimonas pelagia TaxID=1177826 RepID=UPI0031EB3EE4
MALQQRWGAERIRIKACLPMPLSAYRQDFDDTERDCAESRRLDAIIETLAQQGEELLVVPSHLSDEQLKVALLDGGYGLERNTLYLNQSVFVAKYANVLLALWDGLPAKGAGGTADAVSYKLGLPTEWPLGQSNPALAPVSAFDGQVGGLVHRIPVSRIDGAEPATPLYSAFEARSCSGDLMAGHQLWVCQGGETQSKRSAADFLSEEFNRLVRDLNHYNELAPGQVQQGAAAPGLTISLPAFRRADAVALSRQTEYRRVLQRFFVTVLIVLVLYELASNFLDSVAGIGIFGAIFVGIGLSALQVKLASRREIKWKYQLARGIAEGMRIRGFLNAAAVPPSAAPLIPRRFRQHLPLLNHAIAFAEWDWWYHKTQFCGETTRQVWLDDQLRFFGDRLQTEPSRQVKWQDRFYKRPRYGAKKCKRWAKALFNASILFAFGLFAVVALEFGFDVSLFAQSKSVLMLGVQYCLMAAGAVALWGELTGYGAITEGYQTLEQLYRRADELLEGDWDLGKEVMLTDLAREAMFEHVTWHNAEAENDIKRKQQL